MVINTDGDVYEREQMITRPSNYHNQLIIIDSALSIAGVTCQISNTIGLSQIYPIIGKIIIKESIAFVFCDEFYAHRVWDNTLSKHSTR